jgi:plastocyanin
MKKIIITAIMTFIVVSGFSTTVTIQAIGFAFSQDSVTINLGDSVNFTINANHNAVEVSQATWNANGTTSNGGFSVAFGGGVVLPSSLTVGVHYYVCQNHVASNGMKGRIYVINASGINNINLKPNLFSIFPNPSSGRLVVNYNVKQNSEVVIKMRDITGKNTMILTNESKTKGAYTETFDIDRNQFAKGTYFIELLVGDKKSTLQFVLE